MAASAPGPLWSSLALQIDPADSPLEREADQVAARVVSSAPPSPPAIQGGNGGLHRKCSECEEEDEKKAIHRQSDGSSAGTDGHAAAQVREATSAPGQPLDQATRGYFEPRFGRDFGDVRVHTDMRASDSARALHARAYTAGSHVVFRSGEFAPSTSSGRTLLAHELTHVVQQGAGAQAAVQRAEDPNAPVCKADPILDGYQMPPEFAAQSTPGTIDVTIDFAEFPEQSFDPSDAINHEPVHLSIPAHVVDPPTTLYAVPIQYVSSTEEEARSQVCFDTSRPSLLSSSQTSRGAGMVQAFTADGALPVVHATETHIVTTKYTKLAVGAGSTTVLQTIDGFLLIDAGVHQVGKADKAIAEATIKRLTAIIGDHPIDILLSHQHLDHTALLEAVAERFEIRSLRTNEVQRIGFEGVEAAMARGQAVFRNRRAEQIRNRLRAQLGTAFEGDPGLREKQAAQIEAAVQAEVAKIQPTRVDVLVPIDGGLKLVSRNLGEALPKTAASATASQTTSGYRESGRTSFVDPRFAEQAATGKAPEGKLVDTFSTSYIIDQGSTRLIVMPDLRAGDFVRVRSNFEAEMAALGKPARFQVWDMTHHMQSGFRATNPTQIGELVRFLRDFTNVRTASGGITTDAVIVSAHGAHIDPASVWLLRSLGVEVYIAQSAQEVALIEMAIRGEATTGITSKRYPGLAPTDPLLRRLQSGIYTMNERIDALNAEREGLPLNKRRDVKQRIEAAEAGRETLKTLLVEYWQNVSEQIGHSPNTEKNASVTPANEGKAGATAQRINAELARLNITDAPAVGTPLERFSARALVLTEQYEGATLFPEAERLRDARAEAKTLRAQLDKDPGSVTTRARLIGRLNEIAQLLEKGLRNERGASRKVVEDRLAETLKEVGTHYEILSKTKGGTTLRQRIAGLGELIETRVLALDRVQVTRYTERAAAGLGQGLGAVMVYQTIQGFDQLSEDARAGNARPLQFVAGTAKSALGVSVGVRMATRVPVGPGQFVLLSVLDVAETALRDFESPERRNIEITYAIIRNGVSLALMALGEKLIEVGGATAQPELVALGFVIMFLGDKILEELGVYRGLEQIFSFMPRQVTATEQKLRDLVVEYDTIVGALELAHRDDPSLKSIGATNPAGVRKAAMTTVEEHRRKTFLKELELIREFKAAYARVKGGYAGLQEVDQYRRQFLDLKQRASDAGAGNAPKAQSKFSIDAAAVFTEIEKTMEVTDAEVLDMEQWDEFDTVIERAERLAFYPNVNNVDWEELADLEGKLVLMMQNARYRLNPRAFGDFRATPLLPENSPARALYETKLAQVDLRLVRLRRRVASASMGVQPEGSRFARPEERIHGTGEKTETELAAEPLGCSMVLDRLEYSVRAHRILLLEHPPLPCGLTAKAIYSNEQAVAAYRYFIKSDDGVSKALWRLQASENGMIGQAEEAGRTCAASPDSEKYRDQLHKLTTAVRTQIEERRDVNAFLFADELPRISGAIRQREVSDLAARLGQTADVRALSVAEIIALERGDALERIGAELTTIENQLTRLPAGKPIVLARIVGDWGWGWDDREVRASDNVIVAVLRQGVETISLAGDQKNSYVLPVNRAAITLFGGRDERLVPNPALVHFEAPSGRPEVNACFPE